MSFSPAFTLQKAAIVEVLSQLFGSNIPKDLEEMYSHWEETETEVVKGKIQQLSINAELKEKLIGLVRPIFGHIRKAKDVFTRQLPNTSISSIQSCIRMCPWGVVDMKKSAEALLGLGIDDVSKLTRYRLAVNFRLQDHISRTYEELDDSDKLKVSNRIDYVLASGQRKCRHFMDAVLDGNEVAARHFWSDDGTWSNPLVDMIYFFKLKVLPDTNPGLYLFMISCYPNDTWLREMLQRSVPFLLSLLEWPYQDVLLRLFQDMKCQRYYHLKRLINAAFNLEGDSSDTLRQFLKQFVVLVTDDQSSDWRDAVLWSINQIFYNLDIVDRKCFRFVLMLMEFLEEGAIVRFCGTVSDDIVQVIRGGFLGRMYWLFRTCLNKRQSDALKQGLFCDKTFYSFFYKDHMIVLPDHKELVKLVGFCCTSQERLEEMMSQLERYSEKLQAGVESFRLRIDNRTRKKLLN